MPTSLPLVIDHDAGTNPDDLLACLLLLSAGASIRMTLSGNRFPVERAQYIHHFFSLAERADIPCFAGDPKGISDFYGQDAIRNSTYKPQHDYISALKNLCQTHDKVIYVALQGLTNLDQFLMMNPALAPKLDVYHMGLSLTGADTGFIKGGTNIEADPQAARILHQGGAVKITTIGSHTTINDALRVSPETVLYQKIAQDKRPHVRMIHDALQAFHARRGIWPALHDPLAASVALGKRFVQLTDKQIDFQPDGTYRTGTQTPVTISDSADYDAFMAYFAALL